MKLFFLSQFSSTSIYLYTTRNSVNVTQFSLFNKYLDDDNVAGERDKHLRWMWTENAKNKLSLLGSFNPLEWKLFCSILKKLKLTCWLIIKDESPTDISVVRHIALLTSYGCINDVSRIDGCGVIRQWCCCAKIFAIIPIIPYISDVSTPPAEYQLGTAWDNKHI